MQSHLDRCIKRWCRGDEDLEQEARLVAWQASKTSTAENYVVRAVKYRLINLRRDAQRMKRGGCHETVAFDEDRDGSWQLDVLNFKQQYPWLVDQLC